MCNQDEQVTLQCDYCRRYFHRNKVEEHGYHLCKKLGISNFCIPSLKIRKDFKDFFCLICFELFETKQEILDHYKYHHSVREFESLGYPEYLLHPVSLARYKEVQGVRRE